MHTKMLPRAHPVFSIHAGPAPCKGMPMQSARLPDEVQGACPLKSLSKQDERVTTKSSRRRDPRSPIEEGEAINCKTSLLTTGEMMPRQPLEMTTFRARAATPAQQTHQRMHGKRSKRLARIPSRLSAGRMPHEQLAHTDIKPRVHYGQLAYGFRVPGILHGGMEKIRPNGHAQRALSRSGDAQRHHAEAFVKPRRGVGGQGPVCG